MSTEQPQIYMTVLNKLVYMGYRLSTSFIAHIFLAPEKDVPFMEQKPKFINQMYANPKHKPEWH